MNIENLINCFRFSPCQLDIDDYAELLATIKSANMDIYVDWYPYTDFT